MTNGPQTIGRRIAFGLALAALLAPCPSRAEEPSPGAVAVDSVVLRLIDEASAPALRSGALIAIRVKEGDAVERGQVLAELDSREAALAVKAAEHELAIADEEATNDVQVRFSAKAHEAARAELRRSEESIRSFPKSVSQSQIDVERLEVEKTALEKEQAEQIQLLAQLEVKVKQAAVDAARLELAQRSITAPLDGVVVEAPVKLGEWLEPGQSVVRLVNTARLKAEGFIAAPHAKRVTPGQRAMLTVAGGEQRFTGVVVFVSPEVDPINNQVRVWAEIENTDGLLRPGQRAEMMIEEP